MEQPEPFAIEKLIAKSTQAPAAHKPTRAPWFLEYMPIRIAITARIGSKAAPNTDAKINL